MLNPYMMQGGEGGIDGLVKQSMQSELNDAQNNPVGYFATGGPTTNDDLLMSYVLQSKMAPKQIRRSGTEGQMGLLSSGLNKIV